jgi:NIPSNAP protein
MTISKWTCMAIATGTFVAGFAVRGVVSDSAVHAQSKNRVFELRTYTAAPGKFDALNKRFRDHTLKLFTKHGMTNVGYWTPADEPRASDTLIYVLAHESREAAKKSWDAFRTDPDWIKVRDESQKDGSLTAKAPESVYMNPTDYSPIK